MDALAEETGWDEYIHREAGKLRPLKRRQAWRPELFWALFPHGFNNAENPDRTSDAGNSANDFHSIILDDGGKVHSSKMLGKFRTLTVIVKIEC